MQTLQDRVTMKFNINKTNMLLGTGTIIGGCIMAFFQPVAGAILGGIGGVLLQLTQELPAPIPAKKPVMKKKESEDTK